MFYELDEEFWQKNRGVVCEELRAIALVYIGRKEGGTGFCRSATSRDMSALWGPVGWSKDKEGMGGSLDGS